MKEISLLNVVKTENKWTFLRKLRDSVFEYVFVK